MNDVKLRRYQDILKISGMGVIVFGLWSCVKMFMFIFMQSDMIRQLAEQEQVSRTLVVVIMIVLLSVVSAVVIGWRLFVGLSARSEARGKKKGYFYIILSLLIGVFILVADILSIMTINPDRYVSIADMVISYAVDLTALVTLGEMIVASFMVKKLRKEQGEG